MAHHLIPLCLLLSLTLLHSHGTTADTADPETFRVMLQADSEDAYRQIIREVEAVNAEVSHRLPIINAVGARVSVSQLKSITDSPAIARLIDDLDTASPEPEPPEELNACGAAASLELRYRESAAHWQLYNKGDNDIQLLDLSVTAPDALGDLVSILWSGEPMPLQENTSAEDVRRNTLVPAVPQRIARQDNIELSLVFDSPVDAVAHPQRDFTLEARFGEDCSVELIPGYADNSADTYYPTVTGADLLHRHGITGEGVTVAVLDSGLWETERITRNTRGSMRVLARYDAVTDRAGQSFDESGHGTHMTSIIAQSGEAKTAGGGSFRGIAPDVGLISVKAFEANGQGDFLNIIRGLQWVLDNRDQYDIRVLNLSFAARPRWPYWLDPINQAVMRLWQAGVVVVAAAGNEGPGSMTVGSPGNLPYVITVGSVTDSWTTDTENDDYIPDFSSRGPTPSGHIKPDIVAPGGHMSGLTRPGSTLHTEFPEYRLSTGDFVMTGTSQSTAVVSGLVALLLQLDATLSPDDVKCMITSSANPAINADGKLSYSPFQQGSGYVNIHRAITLGDTGCGNAGMDIGKDIARVDFFHGPAILEDIENPTLPDLEMIYDGSAPEKGLSENRRWGVKAHVERLESSRHEKPTNSLMPDWKRIYQIEKSTIEQLRYRD
ncbi:S8 family peptidase [Chromatocurvus halotolerans]|uniref:Subtilisin family serine protease n=1 Tax=Chromatocurvus halotolerans TaxID=1132028 RepID=A0A4R2L6U9_9GAMM|nr:S8 family peptidase [Chromatocurvus halotolerans]TCO74925.1 subtilisin family serine protease [Chromatocurvus halotolerans]